VVSGKKTPSRLAAPVLSGISLENSVAYLTTRNVIPAKNLDRAETIDPAERHSDGFDPMFTFLFSTLLSTRCLLRSIQLLNKSLKVLTGLKKGGKDAQETHIGEEIIIHLREAEVERPKARPRLRSAET